MLRQDFGSIVNSSEEQQSFHSITKDVFEFKTIQKSSVNVIPVWTAIYDYFALTNTQLQDGD